MCSVDKAHTNHFLREKLEAKAANVLAEAAAGTKSDGQAKGKRNWEPRARTAPAAPRTRGKLLKSAENIADNEDDVNAAVEKLKKAAPLQRLQKAKNDPTVALYRRLVARGAASEEGGPMSAEGALKLSAVLKQAGYAASSVTQAVGRVRRALRDGGTDAAALGAVKRAVLKGGGGEQRATPITVTQLRAWCEERAPEPEALADTVLRAILVGFSLMLRASEIIALRVGDVDISRSEMTVCLRQRKTDQEGRGTTYRLARMGFHEHNMVLCPVAAAEDALRREEETNEETPLFGITIKDIQDFLDARCTQASGSSARTRKLYTPHSIRSGGAQANLLAGVSDDVVKSIGGWRSQAYEAYRRDIYLTGGEVEGGFRTPLAFYTRAEGGGPKRRE